MDPYCFVITSFNIKDNLVDLKAKFAKGNPGPAQQIDFDKIYADLIKPAILKAGLEPLIELEEKNFGSIHKTMYEKILLCEFCVADLTNMNPNAYYELGMRYAVRPHTTIPIIASSHLPMLPFDIASNRTFIYQVNKNFKLSARKKDVEKLAAALVNAKQNRSTDSPLYDMINGISFQNSVAHEKTDVFRDKVRYDESLREELAYARTDPGPDEKNSKAFRIDAINRVVEKHRPLENIETAVLIDIMISYRNIDAFAEMLRFIEALPRYVSDTVMVQEQYAFVLNRVAGKKDPADEVMIGKAERVLQKLETDNKASSESYGIWGRIHKDRFDRSYKKGDAGEATFHLENALKYYQLGFESDPRDAYPGVNYVTCLELLGKKDQSLRLLPAVEYAVTAKMKRKTPDYWDYATLLELAVIENRFSDADKFFNRASPLGKEVFMLDTTKKNLILIMNYRIQRKEDVSDLQKLIVKFPESK